MLDKKAKVSDLEAKVEFMLENEMAKKQAKILQIQEEVARARGRTRVYANMEPSPDNETKEV